MACENLSNYYPIVMKFSGYLLLQEDTSAIDFGPDRSILLVGHAPKVGHSGLDCSIELELQGYVRLHWVVPIIEAIRKPVHKIQSNLGYAKLSCTKSWIIGIFCPVPAKSS